MTPTTAIAPTHSVTPQQVAQYQRDGFLIVPGLYDNAKMVAWKALLKGVLDEEQKQSGNEWSMAESGVRVWNSQAIHPTILAAMKDDHVTPILKQLIGPDVEFLSAKVVYKNSATSFASPWHQDWFYWEGAHKMSVWIAMDDATPANGCLKFVPGSHVKVFPKMVANGNAFTNQIDVKDLEGWPVITAAVKRGDAVFFHDCAIHSSHPNTAKTDRWSLISTYRNASVRDECGLSAGLWSQPTLVSGKSIHGAK